MHKYGYVRVSSIDQNQDRQITMLIENGVNKKYIYSDKLSGKDFERVNYKKLLKRLKKDDELYISSIDRLGRNYSQILEQWSIITKKKKANIIVLDMPLLDTRNSKDLAGTLIADIVLQLLSYVAQTEREQIRERQRQGIAIAKQKGVKFGRKKKEKTTNYKQVKQQYLNKEISCRVAAKQLNVSHKTFLRWVKENDESKENGD